MDGADSQDQEEEGQEGFFKASSGKEGRREGQDVLRGVNHHHVVYKGMFKVKFKSRNFCFPKKIYFLSCSDFPIPGQFLSFLNGLSIK